MPFWKADSGSHNMKFPALEHSLPYSRSQSNGPDCGAPDESNQLQAVILISFSLSLALKAVAYLEGFH
jgi:hypothetical protein